MDLVNYGSDISDQLQSIIKSNRQFKTITPDLLTKISSDMEEINRASTIFGRRNSQTTSKLMSLNMISHTPYRQLRQCLAQIESKRLALKENLFKLQREEIKLAELQNRFSSEEESLTVFEKAYLLVDIEETKCNLNDSKLYYEGALKEVGIFQSAYREICETHNIPPNWDELDFELEELQAHKKTAFLHAIRDIVSSGRLNMGTLEYLEQFGISHTEAFHLCQEFILNSLKVDVEGKVTEISDIKAMYNFIDQMAILFKDSHLSVMDRIGIKNLITRDFLYREP